MPQPRNSTTTSEMPGQKRSAPSDSTGNIPKKRSRLSGTTSATPVVLNVDEIEAVDLATDDAVQNLLQKEREDLVKSQNENNNVTKFGDMSCIICMDNFTDITATACGHIFCHECLLHALDARMSDSNRSGGNCPVCRKSIRPTTKNQVIPLSFMTQVKYQSSIRI